MRKSNRRLVGRSTLCLVLTLTLSNPAIWGSMALAQIPGDSRDASSETRNETRSGNVPMPAQGVFAVPDFGTRTASATAEAGKPAALPSPPVRELLRLVRPGSPILSAAALPLSRPLLNPQAVQTPNPAPGSSTGEPKKKSRKLKWILIAAGGAAGAAFALRGNSDSPSDPDYGGPIGGPISGPTVTVGPPTVGAPQ